MASSYQRCQNKCLSSKRGAGGAGFASLGLIPAETNTALAFPLAFTLALAFSSGFLSIFSVDLVNVAMLVWPRFCFTSSLFLDLNNPCGQNCISKDFVGQLLVDHCGQAVWGVAIRIQNLLQSPHLGGHEIKLRPICRAFIYSGRLAGLRACGQLGYG
jgi:hypothetical protein